LLAIILVATLFEGFGVAMLYPVMDFIEKGKDIAAVGASSKMWVYIIKIFEFLSIPLNLVVLMGIVFVLLIIRQLFNYFKNVYSNWLMESIFSDIRSYGFKWFINADMEFYDSKNVGELINALTVDGIRAGSGIFSFFNLIAAVAIFVLYFVFLFILSTGMTLFAMVIMGGVGLLLRSKIKKSNDIGIDISRYNEKISFSIMERLNGIRFLKLAATETKEIAFIKSLSEKIKSNTCELAKLRAKMEFIIDPLVILAGLIILYFSVEIFGMSIAKTGIFIFVLLRIMPYTREIFNLRQALAGFSGSIFSVKTILDEARRGKAIKGRNNRDLQLNKGISFENVFFSYNNNGFVLKNLDIFIPTGKMTALVGRSGAGKSTLIDLIPRLREASKGRILLDNIPIQEFDLGILRRSIAFVSQEGFLFDDTIENNIKYHRPDASSDEVIKVAKMAYADHFIKDLPQGYETKIGQRGTRLSGGQRQRIILARALLQKASIIILDEPTSALDSESELYIQRSIDNLKREMGITMIIVAHRLSTIRNADQIIVLDKGEVVETGKHSDLLHEDTWYADIVKIQNEI